MEAYSGKNPYIFVSYAHSDSKTVIPIIEHLQALGFRIWYDKGIEAGTEWPQYIAEHLAEASCAMVFMSQNAAASHNCRNEINLASELKKEMFVVHLEDFEMPLGLRLQLNLSQAIYRSRFEDAGPFVSEITKAKILQPYKDGSVDSPEKIPETMSFEKPKKKATKILILSAIIVALLTAVLLTFIFFSGSSDEKAPDKPEIPSGIIITDYDTFFEMLNVVSEKLNCTPLWDPSTLVDIHHIDQGDGDVWSVYYTDSFTKPDTSLRIGFRNEGEEIIAVLNGYTAAEIEDAYLILNCLSSSVNGYFLTDFTETLSNTDRVPWKILDVESRSIWNEVLGLEEYHYSLFDKRTNMETTYKTMMMDDLVIYVERRSRIYNGTEFYDFTIMFESSEAYNAVHGS